MFRLQVRGRSAVQCLLESIEAGSSFTNGIRPVEPAVGIPLQQDHGCRRSKVAVFASCDGAVFIQELIVSNPGSDAYRV